MANTATSMYFNSSDNDPDYAEYSESKGFVPVGGSGSLRFGYGDWTAECWAYMTTVDGSGFGSFLAFDGVGSEWFTLGYNNASGSTGTRVYLTAGDGTSYNRSDVITGSQLNTWHHHAAGRVGDQWVQWYDGVPIDSVSVVGEYFNFNQFRIGTNGGNYYHAHGYVDQVRVSSIARYGTIEIPSEYHKNWQAAGHGKNAILPENVALLVRSRDATDGSSTFTDDSPYGCPITTTGVTHENTTTVPQLSGNTAIYHDGSPNSNRIYVDAGFTHPKLETAVGDGSIDFWYKNLGTTQTNACVFEIPPYSGATSGVLFQWQSDDLVDVYCGASPALCMEIDMDHAGDWHHYALSKEAKVVTVWKDGSILKCNAASTWTSFAWNGTSDIVIGGAAHNTIYADYSYMDDFRVCHGQSAYSVGFVPYGGQKNVAANRGGVVIDARHPSANSHSINMGRPAIGSDYATNANNYCMNFNGTNQYLHKITKNWRSADDRGTIFAWIYKDDDSGTQDFFTTSDTDTNAHAFIFGIKSTGKMYLQQRASDTDQVMTSTGPSVATGGWHSIALTSDGDDYKFYYDGAASTFTATSGTDDGDWISSVSNRDNVVIGCWLRTSAVDIYDGKAMQVAYWGGSSGTTGVLDADAIAALHAAGKAYDIKGSGNTGNYDSWADDLAGYWRMGNHYLDTPSIIHDASGNDFDLKQPTSGTMATLTFSGTTTFNNGWQDRGYFTPDKYTALLIQSSFNEGGTEFRDTGPGFKRTLFDGTADYAHKAVANWDNSSTQGTILAWINARVIGERGIFSHCDTAGSADAFVLQNNGNGGLSLNYAIGGVWVYNYTSSNDLFVGKGWKLVGVTMGSDNLYHFWVDGVEVSRGTVTQQGGDGKWFNDFTNHDAIAIGSLLRSSAAQFFSGQIAQVGVWGGSSGTTGVLTATQISAINDLGPGADLTTSYATGMTGYWTFGNKITQGTDTGSTIYDQSAGSDDDLTGVSLAAPYAGHSVTASGGPSHKITTSVFGGSSIYFDGSDGKLSIPASPEFAYGTSDFTIDLWIYSEDATKYAGIFCNANGTGNSTEYLRLSQDYDGTVQFRVRQTTQGSDDNEVNVNSNVKRIKHQTWHHIAAQRRSGILELWVDGGFVNSATSTHNHTWGLTEGIELGVRRESQWFLGYMDEIRFSVGIARYSPSIERYANTFVLSGDTGDAYTTLQIQSNGAKSGARYNNRLNTTGYNTSTVTIYGNPVWQNTVGDPFGGANTALYFNGESRLEWADSSDWDIAGSASRVYTLESWVYIPTHTGGRVPVLRSGHADNRFMLFSQFEGTDDHWMLNTYGSHGYGRYRFAVYSGGSAVVDFQSNKNYAVDRWEHIVLQRSGTGQWEFYQDGVLTGSKYDSSIDTYGGAFCIGKNFSGGNYLSFIGYIDQLRLSRDYRRYGSFSLRTAQQVVTSSNSDSQVVTSNSTFGSGENAFTADSYTKLLLQGNSLTADQSSTPLTITNNGGVVLRQGRSAFGANSYYFDGTDAYLSAPDSDDWHLKSNESWTVECWFNADDTTGCALISQRTNDSNKWMIGVDANKAFVGIRTASHTNEWISGSYQGLANTYFSTGQWHHIAATADGTGTTRAFFNGEIIGDNTEVYDTSSAVTGVLEVGRQTGFGYYKGYMDAIRISKGINRYSYTGTNIKAGLNAVHHKHCSLLITSNTYNGSTHFDDISDQGNYWNQTPYSYGFDGTSNAGYKFTLANKDYHTASNIATGVLSYVFWTRLNTSQNDTFLFGSGQGGTTTGHYFRIMSSKFDATVDTGSPRPIDGFTASVDLLDFQWHMCAFTWDGTTNSNTAKIYMDGILDSTSTAAGTDTEGTPTYSPIIGAYSDGTSGGYLDGNIAQMAIWDIVLSASQMNAIFELGPTGNLLTSYSANLQLYYGMGNHNSLAGRPADSATALYDRSGYNRDATGTSTKTPNKGHTIIPSGNVKHLQDGNERSGTTSIRFDGDGDKLTIPDSQDFRFGSQDFTIEFWINKDGGTYGNHEGIISRYWNSSPYQQSWMVSFKNDSKIYFFYDAGAGDAPGEVSALGTLFTSYDYAWTHVVVQRSSRAAEQSELQLYLNGILVSTDGGTIGTTAIADGDTPLIIGGYRDYIKGLYNLDEIAIYKGVAKYQATALIGLETGSITPSHLDDPSGNHFVATTGMLEPDQLLDTPENNFCTLNPLNTSKQMSGTNYSSMTFTFSEGNTKMAVNGSQWGAVTGTFGVNSGKWYFECDRSSSANHKVGWAKAGFEMIGMSVTGGSGQGFADVTTGDVALGFKVGSTSTGSIWFDGPTADFTHGAAADKPYANYVGTVGIAIDFDNGKFYASHEGKWLGNQDPANGAVIDSIAEFVTGTGHWLPMCSMADNGVWQRFNFGQGDPDGENNYTDSNERGGFRYEPPAGFLSLCTANMTDAAYAPIGPTVATTADQHFDTVLWRGDTESPRHIGGLNFQPDLVWMKSRTSGTNHHSIFDTLRGPNKRIISNQSGAEDTQPMCLSFDPDGFTIGDDRNNAENFVAWCWKAGNGTVENLSGSINSTVSANILAGFSIVSYEGNLTAGATVGHGLGKVPTFIIIKNRESSTNWRCFHKDVYRGGTYGQYQSGMKLNTADTPDHGANSYWNNVAFTSETFALGTSTETNENGKEMIAYCWTDIEGFSKFGFYKANGNADGPFVYCGFRPALVICRKNGGENWVMYDNKRSPHQNPNSHVVYANLTAAEGTSGLPIDFLANGFKMRSTDGNSNSGSTHYFYMAWAETPFKYANAG